jgi:hypothetical protein
LVSEITLLCGFTTRINRLSEAFKGMTKDILTNCQPLDCDTGITLIDSIPVITCSGKRSAKVALEIIDKGYCSTKGIYYYGLKLHALGFDRTFIGDKIYQDKNFWREKQMSNQL